MKILCIAGARPNFMKIAPLMWEFARRPGIEPVLVHTGQHYDYAMSQSFFEELNIPRPDRNLGVGSGSHAVQTAEVMAKIEPVILETRPDVVLVVGDVNSSLACALTAVKVGIPVAHVEAGLRSFDRAMPEEINRVLTDTISKWLFATEPSAVQNLVREGVPEGRIYLVGNVMIDTLLACREASRRSMILEELDVTEGKYGVLTLHRPSNVDDRAMFQGLMRAIGRIQREMPIVFPVHPRTRQSLAMLGSAPPGLKFIDPLGYLDFMKLVSDARLVLTDSGGLQEETTVLGIPCLTLRTSTERPITIEQGTNTLVGVDPERIVGAALDILGSPLRPRRIPELWDGRASARIADVLLSPGS